MASAGKAKTDEQEIRELIANWAEAVRERNLSGAIARHSQDMVMFDVPPPFELRGIEQYKASWAPFFDCMGDSRGFEVDQLEVTAGEDVAFCHAGIRCWGWREKDRKELNIRLTVGLRKIDGEWIVTHEHHSEPAAD
jgi:uncharacterized protein (TIGR02246 family)